MSTDAAEATAETVNGEGTKKRGGQRGERPFRDKPTARERVMNGSLAEYIKSETGKEVSTETIRAVRYCLPKWSNADSTKTLRENMDKKLEKAKLQDRREKALAMLREADSELSKFTDEGDLDDDDEEDEEDEEFEDTSNDSSDDDDEDAFGDEKVEATFG
jgi:hypothetical protein